MPFAEQTFTEVFNAIGHPIVVLDRQHGIIAANPAAGQLFGQPAAELIGQRCFCLFHGPDRDGPPVGCPMVQLEGNRPVTVVEMEMETVGGTFLVSCTPVLDDQGELSRVIHIATDITDRKRAELAERHARILAQAIADVNQCYLEHGTLSSMAQTLVRKAVELSGAELGLVLDWPRPDPPRILAVSGSGWQAIQGTLEQQAHQSMKQRGHVVLPTTSERSLILEPLITGQIVVANSATEHPAFSGMAPQGHPCVDNFLGVPMDLGQQRVGMIALANREGGFHEEQVHDLQAFAHTALLALSAARSEEHRIQAEEQLRESQKMEAIGRLAGGVAHDFNNLLAPIMAYSEMALETIPAQHPLHEDLSTILTSARRAAELTQQLLSFSRKQLLKLQVVDVNRLVADVTRMLGRVLGEDVELVTHTDPDAGCVLADAGRLNQVLMNLVVNAREAMADGGRITVETRCVPSSPQREELPAGQYVEIHVSDTGIGMEPDVRDRVFEPFFTTKSDHGTGLGLSTAYGIVKQHGGQIQVSSRPGHGSTFSIHLPWVAEQPDHLDATLRPVVPRPVATVLVAEDEPVVRHLACRILQAEGHMVLAATSGAEALTLSDGHPGVVDLLLTDVVMPGMNGPQLYEQLVQKRPGIQVIYMSGYANDMIGKHGLDPNTPFLHKPFPVDTLRRTVSDVLARAGIDKSS